MAYIGKVNITSEWTKLEDLIKSQVTGQDSFSFDEEKIYNIQVDLAGTLIFGAQFCNSASEPTESDAGEHLEEDALGIYQPETGNYLWVKTRGNTTRAKVSVSEQ